MESYVERWVREQKEKEAKLSINDKVVKQIEEVKTDEQNTRSKGSETSEKKRRRKQTSVV